MKIVIHEFNFFILATEDLNTCFAENGILVSRLDLARTFVSEQYAMMQLKSLMENSNLYNDFSVIKCTKYILTKYGE